VGLQAEVVTERRVAVHAQTDRHERAVLPAEQLLQEEARVRLLDAAVVDAGRAATGDERRPARTGEVARADELRAGIVAEDLAAPRERRDEIFTEAVAQRAGIVERELRARLVLRAVVAARRAQVAPRLPLLGLHLVVVP